MRFIMKEGHNPKSTHELSSLNWRERGAAIKKKWALQFVNDIDEQSITDRIAYLQELRAEYYVLVQIPEEERDMINFLNSTLEQFLRLETLKTGDPTGNTHDQKIVA